MNDKKFQKQVKERGIELTPEKWLALMEMWCNVTIESGKTDYKRLVAECALQEVRRLECGCRIV